MTKVPGVKERVEVPLYEASLYCRCGESLPLVWGKDAVPAALAARWSCLGHRGGPVFLCPVCAKKCIRLSVVKKKFPPRRKP